MSGSQELGFLMGIAKNRKVSITGGEFTQLQNLEIPEEGLVVHLKKVWAGESISENLQKRSN